MHRFFFIALMLWAHAGIAQEVGAAARVNGVEIPVFRLERYFQDFLHEKGRNVQMMTNPGAYKRLKREALEQLIEAELVWQAAQKKNVIAAPQEVRAAMEQLRARFRSEEEYRRQLDIAGFTEETYSDYLKRALSAQRYMDQALGSAPAVSDEAVHEYYAGNPDLFMRDGARVPETEVRERVRDYLLAQKRQQAAKDAIERMRSGAKIEIATGL